MVQLAGRMKNQMRDERPQAGMKDVGPREELQHCKAEQEECHTWQTVVQ
jgi:hypothetical protein